MYSPSVDTLEQASRRGERGEQIKLGHPSIDNTPARASSPSYVESSIDHTAGRVDTRASRYQDSSVKQIEEP